MQAIHHAGTYRLSGFSATIVLMGVSIPLLKPLHVREFRLFYAATAVSLIGDQLTFIALPWLVLKLTADPLAVGSVLALAAIPRAVFMLIGGAVADRFSPRLVLLASNAVRMLLVLTVSALIWSEAITVWHLYVIALAFGLADAFMFPANAAMPPRLLPADLLGAGNSLVQGTGMLTVILGPMFAGIVITFMGQQDGAIEDQLGLSTAFLIDSVTYLAPVFVFAVIRDRYPPEPEAGEVGFIDSLLDGLRYAWNDRPIRYLSLMIGTLNLISRGPVMVGVPVYADRFLGEGAAAFGSIVAASGVGALIGIIIAGSVRPIAENKLGLLILIDFALFGAALIGITLSTELIVLCAIFAAPAIMDGYMSVLMITWLHQRVPKERMGRVLSVIMFCAVGLAPISAALAGWLIRWDLSAVMLGSGIVMWVSVAFGLLLRPVRRMGMA